jgi:capsular exopolysaccharide synthesis family protein
MSIQTSERVSPKRPTLGRNFSDEVREHYRTLLRRLEWPAGGSSRALRTLGVTSSFREEGVSTVAAQLAATAASWGDYRVLLVDANLARPTVHQTLEVDLVPGLADFLMEDKQPAGAAESAPAADVIAVDDEQLDAAIQPSPVANLFVLPAGRVLGNPAWAYDSSDVAVVVEKLERRFDLVVFDMPAVGESNSVTRLASRLDGILLVVEADRVGSAAARRTSKALSQAGVHLLGAVLNKRRGIMSPWL